MSGHARLVKEGVTEVFAVRKDFRLQGQERAAGIDQINAGQMVLLCDGLSAALFLHGQRIVGATLNGGIIDKNHTFLATDATNAGDDSCCGYVIIVDVMGSQLG